MTKRVYLYAFDKVLNIVDVKFLEGESISVKNILRLATWMSNIHYDLVAIYAVDNRPGLYKEFNEAVKTDDFTIHVAFADMVSREGLLIQ